MNGLGDRTRSLSPAEGENLWDTLLTTVTPDPQPPSIGSSFASTRGTVSAAGTQTTTPATGSSSTSLAGPDPDLAAHSNVEPPCESCYNSDSEEDRRAVFGEDIEEGEEEEHEDGEDEDDDNLASFLSGLRTRRRSYAEAAGGGGSGRDNRDHEDPLELLSMQRIVRHLAARHDIPDEWWAEAGLSRTLSREGAN